MLRLTDVTMMVGVAKARSFAIAQVQMGPKLVSVYIQNSGVSAVEGF